MTKLDLAFSPCPNDTFIFHAMLHDYVKTENIEFTAHIHDIDALNKNAFSGKYHISKLSFYAYLKLKKHYEILDSGSAIGHDCGPLLISNSTKAFSSDGLIAVPGEHTTAYLLLKLWNPDIKNVVFTRFDNIIPGVHEGKFDAGLIIHEGRFVYQKYNCTKIVDLGQWWENETKLPIPLGCLAIRKEPDIISLKSNVEHIIKSSVRYALNNRAASKAFTKQHAQELDDNVIDSHIDLYVNDFTLSLGDKGKQAVQTLGEMAKCKKII